ncbi:MAG: hypothetical protein PHE24_05385 [Patescibacteria group bacterium]|nr:hypothetical protein [Patescibacteria group bacterium]
MSLKAFLRTVSVLLAAGLTSFVWVFILINDFETNKAFFIGHSIGPKIMIILCGLGVFLLLWLVFEMIGLAIFERFKPVCLIKDDCTILYYYDNDGRLTFRGTFSPEGNAWVNNLLRKFTVADIFRRNYHTLPVVINIDLENIYPLGREESLILRVENLSVIFTDLNNNSVKPVMDLFIRYKDTDVVEAMKKRIIEAFTATVTKGVHAQGRMATVSIDLKDTFIDVVNLVLKNELYKLNGPSFDFTALIEYQ